MRLGKTGKSRKISFNVGMNQIKFQKSLFKFELRLRVKNIFSRTSQKRAKPHNSIIEILFCFGLT